MSRIIQATALLAASASQALAGVSNSVVFISTNIPTLDELGLIGLSVVVGIAGGIAARRRKKK